MPITVQSLFIVKFFKCTYVLIFPCSMLFFCVFYTFVILGQSCSLATSVVLSIFWRFLVFLKIRASSALNAKKFLKI